MSTPEQIQREIESTRASLSADVNALGEKVTPSNVVHRRVDRVKSRATSMKERVMGSSSDAGHSMSSALGSARDSASSAASTVGETVSSAPQLARQQTQGNPLAAGVIAFGVGWLLASLAPASSKEQELAQQAEQQAQQLAEPLKQSAQEVAGAMQQPLQESAEQIKQTATDAAGEVKDQASSAAGDVKDQVRQ